MNAEQKQRAMQMLRRFSQATPMTRTADNAAVAMAALLQELVDAPEPEPVARVTGYYAGYLSIATVDGRVLPAGTALYTAPPHQSEHHLEMVNTPAPSVPDGWIRAIDEAMVVHHIGIADRADSYEVAKKKLNALLAINSDIARDCSEAPADVARDALLQVESEFAALLPGVVYMDEPDGGSPTVQEQIKRMALDAARYRWLLDSNWYVGPDSFYCTGGGELEDYQNKNNSAESLDAAVDAAIAAKKGGAK